MSNEGRGVILVRCSQKSEAERDIWTFGMIRRSHQGDRAYTVPEVNFLIQHVFSEIRNVTVHLHPPLKIILKFSLLRYKNDSLNIIKISVAGIKHFITIIDEKIHTSMYKP